jgi:thioredoxin
MYTSIMVKMLNDKELEKVLEGKGSSLILFMSPFSIPCDHFKPEFEALTGLLKNLSFYRISQIENPGIAEELGVEAVPTTFLFKDGTLVAKWEGPYSKESLQGRVRDALKSARK